MTINSIIAQFDSLMPNVFSEDLKRQWLSEVDYFILNMRDYYVLSDEEQLISDEWEPYIDAVGTTELLLGIPYTDIYIHYMSSKVDYNQMDIQKHNNSLAMYQKVYNEYSNKFNRSHTAKVSTIKAYGDNIITEWKIP